jgi:choline dehydrogenase-like flavoprotein
MHEDPKQGVVDAHCRVHGVANLYIAGSSVFPTSGHANPTLTIVALAVRLADHIKGVARTAERGSSTQADRLARAELDMVS